MTIKTIEIEIYDADIDSLEIEADIDTFEGDKRYFYTLLHEGFKAYQNDDIDTAKSYFENAIEVISFFIGD